VRYTRSVLALLVIVGVPSGAQTFIAPSADRCLAADSTIYRLASASDHAGITVRVGENAVDPDITMQLTDGPATADFVLVDDQEIAATDGCRGRSPDPGRTINVNAETPRPHLIVGLAAPSAKADYKIYVRSAAFSVEEAAALFAVMVRSRSSRNVAGR